MKALAVRIAAAAAYAAAAVVASWPLPRHLGTHLTGTPGGDAGVYLWNIWVFRHELLEQGGTPLYTTSIVPLAGPAPLVLHNYTIATDLLSLPLQPLLGTITAFNVLYLLHVALAGFAMCLLARRVTARAGGGWPEAWLAGLLFAWSPFLIARGTGHFSLASAAALPFFALCFDRALSEGKARDAALAGVCLAWAAYSDAYYAIYGLLLAGCLIAERTIRVVLLGRRTGRRRRLAAVDASLVIVAGATLAIHVLAGGELHVGSLRVTSRTLHTPVLLITVLVAVRVLMTWRPRLQVVERPAFGRTMSAATVAAVIGGLLVLPVVLEAARLAEAGAFVHAPMPWRSGAPGLDLLAFILPSPAHALTPVAVHDWLEREPGGWIENVATLPYVGVLVLVLAWRLAAYRPRGLWPAITGGFMVLALGPFLRVAGLSTLIPLPWAIVRYVPLVGEARMPQRFAVLAIMGFAVLFAAALTALGRRFPERRRLLLLAVGAALVFELFPAPRTLHVINVPDVHRMVAADPAPVRVLELPYGIRDGLSSYGDYGPTAQVFQIVHGKPLLNGYLSRIPPSIRDFHLKIPMLAALAELSAGHTPAPELLDEARRTAPDFIRDAALGYVIVDTSRSSEALERFAVDALQLEHVGTDDQYVLYRPSTRPGAGP